MGGVVIHSGTTGETHRQQVEFRLELESNPEFTGSVLAAYTRQSIDCTERRDGGPNCF